MNRLGYNRRMRLLIRCCVESVYRCLGRRTVFIDCGANVGKVLDEQVRRFPSREYFAVEANPALLPSIESVRAGHPKSCIHVMNFAVWSSDGLMPFYLSRENSLGECVNNGSTVMTGKEPRHPSSGVVDYANPIQVPCLDLSSWLRCNFSPRDFICLKMDIEGAEYEVLDKMLADNTIDYINEAMIEFHYSEDGRISALSKDCHERIVREVRRRTRLVEWH